MQNAPGLKSEKPLPRLSFSSPHAQVRSFPKFRAGSFCFQLWASRAAARASRLQGECCPTRREAALAQGESRLSLWPALLLLSACCRRRCLLCSAVSKVPGPGPVGGPRTEPLTPPLTALTHRRGPGRSLAEGPGVGGRGRPEPPHLLGGRREPDRASRVRSGFPLGLCRSSGLGKDLRGFLFVFAGKGRGRPQEWASPGLRAAAGGPRAERGGARSRLIGRSEPQPSAGIWL